MINQNPVKKFDSTIICYNIHFKIISLPSSNRAQRDPAHGPRNDSTDSRRKSTKLNIFLFYKNLPLKFLNSILCMVYIYLLYILQSNFPCSYHASVTLYTILCQFLTPLRRNLSILQRITVIQNQYFSFTQSIGLQT